MGLYWIQLNKSKKPSFVFRNKVREFVPCVGTGDGLGLLLGWISFLFLAAFRFLAPDGMIV